MKRIASTTLLLAVLGTGVALADAHGDREAVMKANGGAVRALNGLVANFDAAAAKAQGQILVDNAAKIKAAFAPGTDQNDPGALPAVWTDSAGFMAAADKFGDDAQAVLAATDGEAEPPPDLPPAEAPPLCGRLRLYTPVPMAARTRSTTRTIASRVNTGRFPPRRGGE